MTTQDIVQKALEHAVYPFREKRTFICELKADVVGEGVSVSGIAMDPSMLEAVLQDMRGQLEGITVEAGNVRYMRASAPTLLTQTTNLTGLYAEASFRSEMVSQNLLGARLEVLHEEGRWVYARQDDGYLGWAYKPYYAVGTLPPPSHILNKPVAHLHRQPQEDSPLVSLLLAGTYLHPGKVTGDWTLLDETCSLSGDSLQGYVSRQAVRALADLPQDETGRRSQMMEAGLQFIGTPYVWGGCSAQGIDCSGLAQLLHRLVGITTPRDADMQRRAGRKVDPPYQPGDLVFFSDEPETRAITHVGVSMGGWVILHSSRSRNGVYIDDIQAVPHLREMFVDGCTYVGK